MQISRKYTFCPLSILFPVLFLSLAFVQTSYSQTIYKQDKGIFTGIPTLHFQSGELQSFRRIGPWAGYRFNENMDLRIHVEYITSEKKMFSDEFSLYNVGVTGGYTHHMPKLKWRTSVSLYRAFNVKTDQEARFSPEGFSAMVSSGLYIPVKLSNRMTMLPYGSLLAGAGKARIPNGTFSGHSDGFVTAANLGLNVNMDFSAFTFTIGGGYAFGLSDNIDNDADSGVFVTMVFNF